MAGRSRGGRASDKPGAGPGDMPEQLMKYWSTGAGGASINWGVGGDFDRCKAALGKYVDAGMLNGLCNNLHRRATGAPPGHAPGEEASGGGKKGK